MKFFVVLLLAICSAQLCISMHFAVNPIANVLSSIVSTISKMNKSASKQLSSLEGYQAGDVVNVPGEIRAMPTALMSALNAFASLKVFLLKFFDIIQKEYAGQVSSGSGPTFTIPNSVVEPYIKLIGPVEDGFNDIYSKVQLMGGVINNGLIPLLTQTLQANGQMLVPVNVVNALKDSVQEIAQRLQTLSNSFVNAATESENNNPSSESFKAKTIMGEINSICTKLGGQISRIAQNAQIEINNLPIHQVNASQDQVDTIYIVKALNQFLTQFSQMIKTGHGYLAEARAGINLIKNPIGAALFDLF